VILETHMDAIRPYWADMDKAAKLLEGPFPGVQQGIRGPSLAGTGVLEHGAPAMRGDQCADKGCPSKLSDRSPGLFEVVAGYGVNQIALADARPIQAIRFIQDDFVRLSLPPGPFA
jgi:hypothetical protein